MGNHPCPRCLVKKSNIGRLGWARDIKDRVTKARHDDTTYKEKVQAARNIIYAKHFAVNSESVETILKPESLVPTIASSPFQIHKVNVLEIPSETVQCTTIFSVIQPWLKP